MKWQELIAANITAAEELALPLNLTPQEIESIREECATFPMSVPEYYLSLIDPDDPNDPIKKMAIPEGYIALDDGWLDTSGEYSNTKLQGLQHKYDETALVLTTPLCAMLCRHCFRRRLVGKESQEIAADIEAVSAYILSHPEISNVLLSGGDAFMMPTERIAAWLESMAAIDHLDLIRFGTRTPVTFPARILTDPSLCEVLSEYSKKKQIYVVTHFNHPNEVTPESTAAVRMLQDAGTVVKNQTVLLRGVNDDPGVLGALFRQMSSLGIVQHYIFQCRPVQGVKSRFPVPLREGSRIVNEALAKQNGLGKAADYTLSHVTGKIRVLGEADDGRMVFQYKQAKDPALIGRIFTLDLDDNATWLPEELNI
jgi:lysine 2,3-aminomutase